MNVKRHESGTPKLPRTLSQPCTPGEERRQQEARFCHCMVATPSVQMRLLHRAKHELRVALASSIIELVTYIGAPPTLILGDRLWGSTTHQNAPFDPFGRSLLVSAQSFAKDYAHHIVLHRSYFFFSSPSPRTCDNDKQMVDT